MICPIAKDRLKQKRACRRVAAFEIYGYVVFFECALSFKGQSSLATCEEAKSRGDFGEKKCKSSQGADLLRPENDISALVDHELLCLIHTVRASGEFIFSPFSTLLLT